MTSPLPIIAPIAGGRYAVALGERVWTFPTLSLAARFAARLNEQRRDA